MTYQATVCKIKNVRPFLDSKVTRIKLATVLGYQIVVGIDQQEDELGVFFVSDGALSEEHCLANNLYRVTDPVTGKNSDGCGYFGPNGRVKPVKLKGEVSDGFWQPIKCFEWTGTTKKLVEDYQFDTLNGHLICQKYLTPATKASMGKNNPRAGKSNVPKVDRSMLLEHYSTKQVRDHIGKIPVGAIIHITEKFHGTSGRTGYIKTKYLKYPPVKYAYNNLVYKLENFCLRQSRKYNHLRWLKKIRLRTFKLTAKPGKEVWEYISGSRRVVIDPYSEYQGYYNGDKFRENIHSGISALGLQKGEIIYYEIVGFTNNGAYIMAGQGIKDKKLQKRYGDTMRYTYGCDSPHSDVFVYRISHVNEDGYEVDLPWVSVEARCQALGLKTVPLLANPFIYDGDQKELVKTLHLLSDGPSTIDEDHIREGVVIKVEHKDMYIGLKFKGDTFCELESIQKNSDCFIDPEDVE